MNDLTREQCFCQWVISKILALYITQEDFRNEVDSKLNDGYSFSINGEKMGEYEQAEWKLSMVCVDIAKQFTEYYFKELWGDEFEADEDEPQTETQTETQNSNLPFEKADERCKGCKHYKLTCDLFSEICKYEPKDEPQTETKTETQNSNLTFKTLEYCDICDHKGCKECIANALDEHCMPSQFKKQIEDECAKEYEELGLKKLKELIEADRKTEPTQNQHIQSVESVGEDRKTEQTEREGK